MTKTITLSLLPRAVLPTARKPAIQNPAHDITVTKLENEELWDDIRSAAGRGYENARNRYGGSLTDFKTAKCKAVTDGMLVHFETASPLDITNVERMDHIGNLPYPLHYFVKVDLDEESYIADGTYKQYLDHLSGSERDFLPDVMVIQITNSQNLQEQLIEHGLKEDTHHIWLSQIFPDEFPPEKPDPLVLRVVRSLI